MRLHEKRLIDRSIGDVFDYTADFSNIGGWDPGVSSSRKLDDGPTGVGTRFEVVATFGGRDVPMTYEITEFEPNERVVLVGTGDVVDAVDEIRFESQGEGAGTLVDYTADLTFHNYIRYISPLLAPFMRRVGDRALDGLVAALSR